MIVNRIHISNTSLHGNLNKDGTPSNGSGHNISSIFLYLPKIISYITIFYT